MSLLEPDICVIGAGSGGLSVAAGASQMGARVVLIEKASMGGDCLNYGCVPSKALLAAGHVAQSMREASLFGLKKNSPTVSFEKVHRHVHEVIRAIAPHDSVERFEGLGVRVLKTEASFIDEKTVKAGDYLVRPKYFVIATGSHPFIPPLKGLEKVPFLTNETLFDLKECPDHLIILGGGPIGIEMAQAFQRLGAKVTVVQSHSILPKDDPELVDVIRQKLLSEGVTFIEGARAVSVKSSGKNVSLTYKSEKEEKTVSGSHLLVAVGRRPSLKALNLKAAGLDSSSKGINVDQRLRSSQKHIYALGDAIGQHQFTHMASYHAGLVIRNILFKWPAKLSSKAIPRVTYTDPELAHVGMTEKEARTQEGSSFKSMTFPFNENDRAQAEHATEGLIKVLTTKRGHVLGVSIAGKGAGELIFPWSLAITKKMRLSDLAGTIIPYPTYSEVSKRVAGSFYTPALYGHKTRAVVRFLMRWF
tara:strand:+ start:5281 stop:6705 length:1425 start_codon:yes stop_codon:yes gene_type:complete